MSKAGYNRNSVISIRRAIKIHDGLIRNLIKIKLISLLTNWYNKHSNQVEDEGKFKSWIRRLFDLVKRGTQNSIANAILITKGPGPFMLFLSGIGAIKLILMITLLRKLYKAIATDR